jgi:hypothetical protein
MSKWCSDQSHIIGNQARSHFTNRSNTHSYKNYSEQCDGDSSQCWFYVISLYCFGETLSMMIL